MATPEGLPATVRLKVLGSAPIELSFVEEGPELFLVASDPTALWARESVRAPVDVLHADGRVETRIAWPISDPTRAEEVLSAFRRKYGEAAWERYFRGRTRVLALRETSSRSHRPTEEVLRAEFDAVADRYTDAVEHNPFARYLRERSEGRFRRLFERRDPILELGPGTGIETLALLRQGHRVVAVDISSRMLAELRHRVDSAGLSENLHTRLGSIGNLGEVLGDLAPGSFGGALSTFGSLNLEPHLDRLPAALTRLLAPGAPFFAGILNRWGLIPAAYLLLAGHPRVAARRLRSPIVTGGFLCPLEIQSYTGREFAKGFRPGFVLERTEAASVLTPPYWSPPLFGFWSDAGRNSFARLDGVVSGRVLFRELGEYLFVTLRRTTGK
ncbi:MAG: class I SAM-dependent methyltransferase [Thermoplasmata archaeon]